MRALDLQRIEHRTHVVATDEEHAVPELGVHLDRNGRVFHVAGQFTPGLARLATASTPSISPVDAANAVASEAGLTPTEAFRVLETKSLNEVVLSQGGVAQNPVEAKLAYILDDQGMPRLAWEVYLYQNDSQHAWDSFVDAVTGEVLAMYDHVDSDDWGPTPEQLGAAQEDLGPWLFAETTPVAPTAMVGAYRVYGIPVESPSHSTPATPAADWVCPMFDLIEPTRTGPSVRSWP